MSRSLVCVLLLLMAAPMSAQEDTALVDAAYQYLAGKGDETRPSLRLFAADLNDDARSDGIVLLTGSDWCGSGGCKMIVFKGTDQGYVFLSTSTLVQEPVAVLPATVHGYHTLVVLSGGTGKVLMRFNGTAYPSNPSLQPKASKQDIANAQELSKVLHQ